MIIDLSTIDHDAVIRRQRENRIRLKLAKKTSKQLRQFARDNHIPLAGVSNKRALVDEIMSQYGNVWKLKEDEIG